MKILTKYIVIAIIGTISFSLLISYNFNLLTTISSYTDNISGDSKDDSNGSSDDDSDKHETVGEHKEKVEEIDLIVDYGDGSVDSWENFTLDNWETAVFDALLKWCDVEYEDYGWNVFITKINGEGNDPSKNWMYKVNGEIAPVGCATYYLDDGDEILWEYCIPN